MQKIYLTRKVRGVYSLKEPKIHQVSKHVGPRRSKRDPRRLVLKRVNVGNQVSS